MKRPVYIGHAVILDTTSESAETPWLAACLSRVGRKSAKIVSRAGLLMTEVAERCASSSVSGEEREALPIFVGVPSGAEILLPYLRARLSADAAGLAPHGPAELLNEHRAGNALEFLKLSQGNVCGHIAQLTGIRGSNASFTGFSAGVYALRKAHRLVANGWCAHALVVSGETLLDAASCDRPELTARRYRDGAAAVYLTAHSVRACSPAVEIEFDAAEDSPQVETETCAFADAFEAAGLLIALGAALERGVRAPAERFVHLDRWGNRNGFTLASMRQTT